MHCDWVKIWHHIVQEGFDFCAKPHVVFYASAEGTGFGVA